MHPAVTYSNSGRLVLFVIAMITGVTLTGCGQTSNDTPRATAGPQDLEQALRAHEWILDVAGSSLTAPATEPMTLVFEGSGRAAGMAGCNTFRGSVQLSGDTGVRFSDVAATNRLCAPQVMVAESEYLGALGQIQTADVSDRDRLVLAAEGLTLSFSPFDIAVNMVGEWSIVNLRTPDAVTGPIAGTEPTITFEIGGSVHLATGCNTLRSTWTLDGDLITFESTAKTMMSCDEPAGVMDQEAALADALTMAHTVSLTPTALTMLAEDGTIVLMAARA